MKAVTIKELKEELSNRTPKELRELTLRLARFKKENKELLTYLLFESTDESGYISAVKKEVDQLFELINTKTHYYIKKSLRKILRSINKYSRYSLKKRTEVDLLIYFCVKLKAFSPSIRKNARIMKIFDTQIENIRKKLPSLHEDLQFDYERELLALVGSQ